MQNRKDTPFLGLTDPGDILQESKVSLHKVRSTCVMGKRPWLRLGEQGRAVGITVTAQNTEAGGI